MISVPEHYDSHLAPVYAWRCGGADAARTRFTTLLRELGWHEPAAGSRAPAA